MYTTGSQSTWEIQDTNAELTSSAERFVFLRVAVENFCMAMAASKRKV
jgi:hypothetical protein